MSIIISKTRIIGTTPVPVQTWERPSDWLDMPALSQGDEKICYLVKVFEDGENFIRFKVVGDYTVDWGDGTANTNYSSNATAEHEFAWNDAPPSSLTSHGFRQVIVTVTPQSGSTLTGINRQQHPYYATGDTARGGSNSIISVKMAGTGFTNLHQAFYAYTALEEFEYVGTTPNLVTASQVFSQCVMLKKVIQWDISNVTTLSSCFSSCSQLLTLPQLDTSSCTNFASMFQNCSVIDHIPPMNVTSATSLSNTFNACQDLKNNPISDYTGITNFNATFKNTGIKVFEAVLPNATNLYTMFQNCANLEVASLTVPNGQLTNIGYLFSGCNQIKEIKPFDTSAVTEFRYAFGTNRYIRDYGWLNTSSGLNFTGMFSGNRLIDASFIDISSATVVSSLFANCSKLTKLPASFDCTNLTSIDGLFKGCTMLEVTPNLINTGNITNTSLAFYFCSTLKQAPPISGTIANAQQMFQNCYNLEKIPAYDLSGCNSGNETYNFAGACYNLRESLATDNTSRINYNSCALSESKIEEIFDNLGTVSSATVINVSNCPGSAGLTTAQEDIAINKGWTVTN